MRTSLMVITLVTATLLAAAIVSTLSLQHASAKITEETTCDGPGKSCDSQGSAPENNPNVEEKCVAKNNPGHEPPGQNPC